MWVVSLSGTGSKIPTKVLLALKKQVNGFMLFSREKKDELTSQACLIYLPRYRWTDGQNTTLSMDKCPYFKLTKRIQIGQREI